MRVDPAVLATAAAELSRLTAAVAGSRRGADGRMYALAGRVGDLSSQVLDLWHRSDDALGKVEEDFRQIGRALDELAGWFAELDRRAVGR
jgi:hypothetical protein